MIRLLSFKASVQCVEFVFVAPALHSFCIQHTDSVSSVCLIYVVIFLMQLEVGDKEEV